MGEATRRQFLGALVPANAAAESTSTESGLVPATHPTTTTTVPASAPPTGSPVLLVAAGLAGLATILVIWRASRMRDG